MSLIWKHFVHSYPIDCEEILYRRPLEVRASLWCRYFPPLFLLMPATTMIYMTQQSATMHFSHMTNEYRQAFYVFIAHPGVEYWSNTTSTNWWSQLLSVAYCNANFSDESDAKKLEISAKTDVYNFRRVHRRVSCSDGALCSGCGALMCNIQTSTFVKLLGLSWRAVIFQSIASICLDMFCCQHRSIPYLPGVSAVVPCSQTQQCYSGKCGYQNINNGHKNKTVRRSHQWNSGC